MRIVFLDTITLGFPLELDALRDFGSLDIYEYIPDDKAGEIIADADVVITNQNHLAENNLSMAKNLRLICAAGTGYNHIDIEYCRKHGIAVANVPGYAVRSVAQHTFSMLFHLISHSAYYDDYVKRGEYSSGSFSIHEGKDFFELEGKTWGIIGLGSIGKKVAAYAEGFGCNVIYYSTSGENQDGGFPSAGLDELLASSDIISIHAPLNQNTLGLIQMDQIKKMKKTAYLLNLGRGGIVKEGDLAEAVSGELIAGAALDVFEQEPLPAESPLLTIDKKDKIFMTPHIAYGSKEARMQLVHIIYENIRDFFNGERRNRID